MGTEQESGQNVERTQLRDLTDLPPEGGKVLIKGMGAGGELENSH